ncbi:hypothetical protein D9M71_623040 [compost metagenome]
MRSLARKSAENRPPSASRMATRVTRGKWCPLASIWVPTRMQGSPRWMVANSLSMASLREVLSRSMRKTCVFGNRIARRSSARSVPAPTGRRSTRPQSGQQVGWRWVWPQWWQRSSLKRWCRVMRASQRGHWLIQPQSWHSRVGAKPRRLRNTSTCWPAARVWAMACCSGMEMPESSGRLFTSRRRKRGCLAPPARWVRRSRP